MTYQKAIIPLSLGLMLSTITMLGNADVGDKYKDSCAACHDTGALNAPKTGDKALWNKLKAEKGMPALVQSVKNGMPQMPAGGLCSECSNEDYKALIEYMAK